MQKDDFCSYCGTRFTASGYPKRCKQCHRETYLNAPAVGVGVVPVEGEDGREGLLVIQRANKPHIGGWALPGGYKEANETWQEGVAREVLEETGISIKPDGITLWGVENVAANGAVLLFGFPSDYLKMPLIFNLDHETMAAKVVFEPIELCFPHHQKAMNYFFEMISEQGFELETLREID